MNTKPRFCMSNHENCEDCEYWEPIPFHRYGGVCMSRMTARMVMLFTDTPKTIADETSLQMVGFMSKE